MSQDKTQVHTCALCKLPRVMKWSGKWPMIERLFLVYLLARIQHQEGFYNRRRDEEAWKGASPDRDWLRLIVYAAPEHITIADLIVETVVKLEPEINLDLLFEDLKQRIGDDNYFMRLEGKADKS